MKFAEIPGRTAGLLALWLWAPCASGEVTFSALAAFNSDGGKAGHGQKSENQKPDCEERGKAEWQHSDRTSWATKNPPRLSVLLGTEAWRVCRGKPARGGLEFKSRVSRISRKRVMRFRGCRPFQPEPAGAGRGPSERLRGVYVPVPLWEAPRSSRRIPGCRFFPGREVPPFRAFSRRRE